jgi:hypothetical protein
VHLLGVDHRPNTEHRKQHTKCRWAHSCRSTLPEYEATLWIEPEKEISGHGVPPFIAGIAPIQP